MFSKINFKVFFIIITTGTLLIGFQNCSKYNYQDVSSTGVQGFSTDQLGDSSDTIVNQPSSTSSTGTVTPTLPPPDDSSNQANSVPSTMPSDPPKKDDDSSQGQMGTPVANDPPSSMPPTEMPPNMPPVNDPPMPPVSVEPPDRKSVV